MQFTTKFTALALAVVAATVSRATANPAPVEASSNSEDLHRLHRTDAEYTYVGGSPVNRATPRPAALYTFGICYKSSNPGDACPSFCATQVTLSEGERSSLELLGQRVQCIQPRDPALDRRRVYIEVKQRDFGSSPCSGNMGDYFPLDSASNDGNSYSTINATRETSQANVSESVTCLGAFARKFGRGAPHIAAGLCLQYREKLRHHGEGLVGVEDRLGDGKGQVEAQLARGYGNGMFECWSPS
ncbi:hypothetical protein C8T65DRAFT_726745 [Cerioporus squamosus]|nr:hypothetical protein C8T65DRAFT_726745 [Cerioporus squamosus]